MKKEPTKEEILEEMSVLRSEYEMVRRKTKELGNRTTRLYLAIEDLRPDPERKIIVNRKFS